MQIEIKPVREEHLPQITSVLEAAWLVTYPNQAHDVQAADIKEMFAQNHTPEMLQKRKERITNPDLKQWIAQDGELVIGYANVNLPQNEIKGMYVHPDYHGKGVGGRLIEAAIESFDTSEDMVLNVVSYNAKAIRFYKKDGFGVESDGERFQVANGKSMPTV